MSKASTKAITSPGKSGVSNANLAQIMDLARESFSNQNLRFTDLREQVFKEIASTRGSIGAYDILERLADKGTRLAPISVYRSIDALMEAGVIHRLESKNAFFACRRHEHGKKGRPVFLFCEQCGKVTEAAAQEVFDTLNSLSAAVGFEAKVKFVEVSGVCADCKDKPDQKVPQKMVQKAVKKKVR